MRPGSSRDVGDVNVAGSVDATRPVISTMHRGASSAKERIALGPRFEAGLAVSSVNDGILGRGTFDNVRVKYIRR